VFINLHPRRQNQKIYNTIRASANIVGNDQGFSIPETRWFYILKRGQYDQGFSIPEGICKKGGQYDQGFSVPEGICKKGGQYDQGFSVPEGRCKKGAIRSRIQRSRR